MKEPGANEELLSLIIVSNLRHGSKQGSRDWQLVPETRAYRPSFDKSEGNVSRIVYRNIGEIE